MKLMLAELRINSTPIKIAMAFFLVITVKIPKFKSIAATHRYICNESIIGLFSLIALQPQLMQQAIILKQLQKAINIY